ncbi:eukaryotic translation initiation factor 4 gamma 3 [Copidosoma floridanum]|uniref:eukaryotic translation initiation factor 4 gamma 3 n=1 Tax=Copidosoma floridanum TaxID=29053 RepID=UPI0006C97FBD|nr:eukaryotic translation initiation factor 4 gamma 3 [Copidosoma floridanum]
MKDEFSMIDCIVDKRVVTSHKQMNIVETNDNANSEPDDKNFVANVSKDEILLKSVEGRIMQKQKSKNKVKSKDSNRKGINKDSSEMNVSVKQTHDSTSLIKTKTSQDVSSKNSDPEESNKHQKDVKDKDNYESKREQNISSNETVEVSNTTLREVKEQSLSSVGQLLQINSKDTSRKSTSISDNIINDANEIDQETMFSAVTLKNNENDVVSGLSKTCKDLNSCLETLNLISATTIPAMKSTFPLKYSYSDDQWSPINTSGKKVYDRDFLMKLQDDPNSKVKPRNLPDLDVVLKEITKNRNSVDQKSKEVYPNRHEALFPGFAKTSISAKVLPPAKKSHSGKIKVAKPSVIHVSLSLREDVKLRETENAWKPTRLMPTSVSKELSRTEALYKRVRSVLNKLTPQKFDTLVNQVRELQIDTQERLQGVIDLVFEKAVDEPNFSKAYALMCKELANMQVTNGDSKDTNFRKLILTRCQTEFEKDNIYENIHSEKLREINECLDPDKKQELQINLEEEKRKMRIKSVGNIIFVGELFKQNMLTCKIMHQCIQHLLLQHDEENLESLCKLLTTIGKALESKGNDLSGPFKQMQQIADSKGTVSSRIRFMLRDVIDLRINKWIPRRDDSNPKTIDQIQKEAESERLDVQLNYAPSNTPRKDDRVNERKRNRGGLGTIEDGWSHIVGRPRSVYSVEPAKLQNKPPPMDAVQLGRRSNYQWGNNNPEMTTPNKFSPLINVTAESDKKITTHLPGSGSKLTSSKDSGRGDSTPDHGLFSFGNKKESHGAKSDEHGD